MSGGKTVGITIDGRDIRVPAGTTILEAAEQAGIFIPTLCHHKELSPGGVCRICIVEICRPDRDPDRKWIDAACACPVSDGMQISTGSPRIVRERKLILELLLSRAPDSPRIRELAARYGVPESPFRAADGGQSACILCGLCVRVCNELIKADAIGTARRGIEKEVTSPFNVAADKCIGCLACEQVCPTGVIRFEVEKALLKKEDWGVALDMEICPECGAPVGTHVHLEQLRKTTDVNDELLALCPACRRKKNIEENSVLPEIQGG